MSSDTTSRIRKYGKRAAVAAAGAATVFTLGFAATGASAATTSHADHSVVAVQAAKAAPQAPAASAARDLAQVKTAHAAPVTRTAPTTVKRRLSGLTLVENSNANYDAVSNGLQSPVTISDLAETTWSNNQNINSVWWTGSSGKCIREKTNGIVEVSSSCTGDVASEWTWASNGSHYRLLNTKYNNYLATTCVANNCTVKGEANTGSYYLVVKGDGY